MKWLDILYYGIKKTPVKGSCASSHFGPCVEHHVRELRSFLRDELTKLSEVFTQFLHLKLMNFPTKFNIRNIVRELKKGFWTNVAVINNERTIFRDFHRTEFFNFDSLSGLRRTSLASFGRGHKEPVIYTTRELWRLLTFIQYYQC
jgi:hypothetical protein